MISEYEKYDYMLVCDICGVTKDEPFETFEDAVAFKKMNPQRWRSFRVKDKVTGKTLWKDICINCFKNEGLEKWTKKR